MITDQVRNFVEFKVNSLLKKGGYKARDIRWSGPFVAVWIPGYTGHHSVFHGVWRDIERAVWRRFKKRISLYLRRFSAINTSRSIEEHRSNSWFWYNDIWAKGQKRCWGAQ